MASYPKATYQKQHTQICNEIWDWIYSFANPNALKIIKYQPKCHRACIPPEITWEQESPAWTQEAYRLPRSHSNFLLFGGGGVSLDKNFFPQSEHVSSQIWCQKFFPLLRGRGGPPWQNFFFPVWTCIKPNLVSKIFPFTGGGGGPSTKNCFSSLNMYQAKSGVKKFSLYWDRVPPSPLPKIWDLGPPQNSETSDPPQKSETWDPPPKSETPAVEGWIGYPPPSKAGSGTPPPRNVNRLKLLPSPILRMAGGKNTVPEPVIQLLM